jgi:hypothetical protein
MQTEEEELALTIAEMDQIISGKRDKLYSAALKLTMVFCVVSVLLMIAFKINEDFFDANSRIGQLMESVNAQEEEQEYPKINVKVSFKDEKSHKLVIPLDATLDKDNIDVRNEFTKNKYVITLEGYSANLHDDIELTSDSGIMDAVGLYRQNTDVVVEVYCNDTYDCNVELSNNSLSLNFDSIDAGYAAKAVIWLPYSEKKRLALNEWHQKLDKAASENNVKLYITTDMQEEYTQQDVVDFANRINADMVLGIEFDLTDTDKSYMTGICNTMYFVPEHNSAELSILFSEIFYEATELDMTGFYEADSTNPLVSEATVPSAMVKVMLAQKDLESVENEYKLNEKIVTALESTINCAASEWNGD